MPLHKPFSILVEKGLDAHTVNPQPQDVPLRCSLPCPHLASENAGRKPTMGCQLPEGRKMPSGSRIAIWGLLIKVRWFSYPLSTLYRAQKWSEKHMAHLTISFLAETSVNPVSNKAVPQEAREEMMLLSQFPNQKCPLVSCTMHPGWQLAVFLQFTTQGWEASGRSGQLEVWNECSPA